MNEECSMFLIAGAVQNHFTFKIESYKHDTNAFTLRHDIMMFARFYYTTVARNEYYFPSILLADTHIQNKNYSCCSLE